MNTKYYIQYLYGSKWIKTYLGNNFDNHGLFYFDTLEDAKKEIDEMHQSQKDFGQKKLTRYRIIESISKEIIHEI